MENRSQIEYSDYGAVLPGRRATNNYIKGRMSANVVKQVILFHICVYNSREAVIPTKQGISADGNNSDFAPVSQEGVSFKKHNYSR
jgi:hypothetical protein